MLAAAEPTVNLALEGRKSPIQHACALLTTPMLLGGPDKGKGKGAPTGISGKRKGSTAERSGR